jgi:hypothetical protein
MNKSQPDLSGNPFYFSEKNKKIGNGRRKCCPNKIINKHSMKSNVCPKKITSTYFNFKKNTSTLSQ